MLTQKVAVRNVRGIFIQFLVLASHFFCVLNAVDLVESKKTQPKSPIIMTVFIHGTIFLPPSIVGAIKWVKSILGHEEKDPNFERISLYQRYVELSKGRTPYRNQPLSRLGLVPIDLDQVVDKKAIEYFGHKIAHLYKRSYDYAYPNHKNLLKFYIYSWSGRLSKWHRMRYARELYDAVELESMRLSRFFGRPVKIHLVSHSHGSNVVLLGELVRRERLAAGNPLLIKIEKAISFGGPVQSETSSFVNSELFESYINIFSEQDNVQVADFISTRDWFSKRVYVPKEGNSLPTSMRQVAIKVGRTHPSHIELWLWGATPFYRSNFPIYPLPVSVFAPVIVSLVEKCDVSDNKRRLFRTRIDRKGADLFSLSFAEGEKELCEHVVELGPTVS